MEFWRVTQVDEDILIRFRAEHVCPNRQPHPLAKPRTSFDPKLTSALRKRAEQHTEQLPI
jgi:hypothetical protein